MRFFALVILSMLAAQTWAAAAKCDANGDGVIDSRDISVIVSARNTRSNGLGDPLDANGDGVIDAVDARLCVATCTRAGCAVAIGNMSSSSIGPAGGSVQLADGAKVEVPPGALSMPQIVSITEIPLPSGSVLPVTGVQAGKVYLLEPSGQVFNLPVKVTIPYNTSLPTGYTEGAVSIYRRESDPQFNMVGDEVGDPEPESARQTQDIINKRISVSTTSFSAYTAIAVNTSTAFTPSTLTASNSAVVVVKRPSRGGLRTQAPRVNFCASGNTSQFTLNSRAAANIQAIVLHSTNNGHTNRDFDGELGWATDGCNAFFAHYYIDRDGQIYQVADDLQVAQHTRPSVALGIGNPNAIGIEIFNNTGEPFDGRAVAAATRLVDYLAELYAIPRPQRSPMGIVMRNRSNISSGGDRIVSHADTDPSKCDPTGTFRNSGMMATVAYPAGCGTATVLGGNTGAPSLIDMLSDTIAVLKRNGQHTGVINTSGGDAKGLASAGVGGNVVIAEDPANVTAVVPSTTYTLSSQNMPLIVAAGDNMTLSGTHNFTDAVVAGRITVNGALNLNLTGSFYLAPTGQIVVNSGVPVAIALRGTPVIQGLIDSTGADSTADGAPGGNGGNVSFYSASPGLLLVPSIISRGGDGQVADVSLPIGTGGRGGNITVMAGAATSVNRGAGSLFIGGGTGVRAVATDPTSARPAIRLQLDPIDYFPPDYIGDHLPIFPPFYYSSIGATIVNGNPIPLRKFGGQAGFTRGLLSSGGFGGGAAATSVSNQSGAPGGSGGAINIGVGAGGFITFRDADLMTGADIEMATTEIVLPEGGAQRYLFFVPSGGAGGKGRLAANIRTGGDGGPGGAAGSIAVTGRLVPAPVSFAQVGGGGNPGDIIGFNGQIRLFTTDDLIFDFIIGRAVEARGASAEKLYRLRLDTADRLLGGSGGSPSGGIFNEFPGSAGVKGPSGSLVGLPVR